MEPEQSTIGKRVDTHAVIMKELAEIRCVNLHSVHMYNSVSQMCRIIPRRRAAASAFLPCLA